jgi:hypothetical protein
VLPAFSQVNGTDTGPIPHAPDPVPGCAVLGTTRRHRRFPMNTVTRITAALTAAAATAVLAWAGPASGDADPDAGPEKVTEARMAFVVLR